MDRYAILDENQTVVNIIVWDGVSEWSPPKGCTVRLATDDDVISN